MTITYQTIDEVPIIEVLLDGKVVGTINKVDDGYQYRANGRGGNAGLVFPHVVMVKQSIEGTD